MIRIRRRTPPPMYMETSFRVVQQRFHTRHTSELHAKLECAHRPDEAVRHAGDGAASHLPRHAAGQGVGVTSNNTGFGMRSRR